MAQAPVGSENNQAPSTIEVGFVARAHGIKGELRVHLHDKDSTSFDFVERCVIGSREFDILGIKFIDEGVILELDSVEHRNDSEGLKGKTVHLFRDDLDLEEGQYFVTDLKGLDAVLPAGEPYGKVVAVIHGFQDRLVIADGEIERELPFVDQFVTKVDWDTRKVWVNPPEGLPERNTNE